MESVTILAGQPCFRHSIGAARNAIQKAQVEDKAERKDCPVLSLNLSRLIVRLLLDIQNAPEHLVCGFQGAKVGLKATLRNDPADSFFAQIDIR